MQVICRKFIHRFCMIMHPVQVPQATASPIEMKLAVKVSQYLFSPVKVCNAFTRLDKRLKNGVFRL